MRRFRVFVVVIIVCAAIFLALSSPDLITWARLAHMGSATVGTVVAKEGQAARVLVVHYTADQIDYEVRGSGGYSNPPPEQVAVGDRVLITLLPSEPGVAILGDPWPRLTESGWLIVGTATLAAALVVALHWDEIAHGGIPLLRPPFPRWIRREPFPFSERPGPNP